MTTPTKDQIERLNGLYCQHSGMESRLHVGALEKNAWWSDYIRAGFTTFDLVMVITRLRREIRRGDRNIGCLKLQNLIGDLISFEAELSTAKNEQPKPPPPTPKDKFLRSVGRGPETVEVPNQGSTKETVEQLVAKLRRSVDEP